MPLIQFPYNRIAAVAYAHRWAYRRNPRFYDYEKIGGDCTNFASQCMYAGSNIMNYTPDYGWYYINANNKAPAWTGVPYLFRFLTRDKMSVGPIAIEVSLDALFPGDIVQLSIDGITFTHTPIVVSAWKAQNTSEILVAAHSYDCDNRPLNTYEFQTIRCLHIVGVNKPEPPIF